MHDTNTGIQIVNTTMGEQRTLRGQFVKAYAFVVHNGKEYAIADNVKNSIGVRSAGNQQAFASSKDLMQKFCGRTVIQDFVVNDNTIVKIFASRSVSPTATNTACVLVRFNQYAPLIKLSVDPFDPESCEVRDYSIIGRGTVISLNDAEDQTGWRPQPIFLNSFRRDRVQELFRHTEMQPAIRIERRAMSVDGSDGVVVAEPRIGRKMS